MTDRTNDASGPTNAAGVAPPRPELGRVGKLAAGSSEGEAVGPAGDSGTNWSALAVTLAVVAYIGLQQPLLLVIAVPFAAMAVLGQLGREEWSRRMGAGALVISLVFLAVLYPWLLAVILALVVMIFLHELGHYVMAKRAGMKVTEFFLGFGPRIWSTQRGRPSTASRPSRPGPT